MDQYGKSVRAVTYFTPELAQIVEEESKKTGQSVSNYIYTIIESTLLPKNNTKTVLENIKKSLKRKIKPEIIIQDLENVKPIISPGLVGVIDDAIYNTRKLRNKAAIECIDDAITVIKGCEN